MDSIMPAFTALFRPLYGLILLLAIPLTAQANAFEIRFVEVSKIGEGYSVDARIGYQLTPIIEEALDNGVPITFIQQLQIVRRTPILWDIWNWDHDIWQHTIQYELRYHDLSQQYLLYAFDNQAHRNFPTLTGALTAMGEIGAFQLPREYTANPRGLLLRLKSGIDVSALPSPMRPGAFLSRKWNLSSPWYEAEWPLK